MAQLGVSEMEYDLVEVCGAVLASGFVSGPGGALIASGTIRH